VDDVTGGKLLEGLRRARSALLDRPSKEIARLLGSVGARFLDPADELRAQALELIPDTAGVSLAMAREVLDGMAADWSAARLERLLDLELAGGDALDGFVRRGPEGLSRALGAELTVHVCAGTVPGVSVTSMVRALLVKSAVLLKPGRGDEVLPVLFRRALSKEDPRVGDACAVVYWPGGSGAALESRALREADLVVVYGGDDTVRSVRGAAHGTTPVVAYPHRLSFGVVGRDALAAGRLEAAASDAARAVALFDQRGCVSPHLFYVLGDEGDATTFADALADQLRRLEHELPSGAATPAFTAALHQLRGTAELLAVSGQGRLWCGEGTTWTVVASGDHAFEPSCLGRAVRVKPADGIEQLLEVVRPFSRHLQTVGVAGLDARVLRALAEGLSRIGPVRIAPMELAPWPPPWWHHDGMGPLTSLVRWSDLEEWVG
jgi:hypothetical protein